MLVRITTSIRITSSFPLPAGLTGLALAVASSACSPAPATGGDLSSGVGTGGGMAPTGTAVTGGGASPGGATSSAAGSAATGVAAPTGVATTGAPTGSGDSGGGSVTGGAGMGTATGGGAQGTAGTGSLGSGGAGGASGGVAGAAGSGGAGEVLEPKPALVTSGRNAYWQVGSLAEASGGATISVDESTTYQQWLGFGGTFNEAGWDALSVLDPAERDRAIRLLFHERDGAGFDWGRIPIGASDYALSRYTLAETPGDYAMESFSIARDREMLIPYVKAAVAVKSDVRLWASPWSPPAWMKDSGEIDGNDADTSGNGATFTSNMLSDTQTLDAFALYLSRFVEEYAAEGLVIDHVQPQNEPGYATRYPSCLWGSGLLASFVASHLAPTFTSRGITAGIWFGTLSNNETYGAQVNGLSRDAVVGVGLQWNTVGHVGELAGQGYLVMQTEHRCGNNPWEAGFNPDMPPNDHAYALYGWSLIKEWIDAGVHVYSAWNMVLDTEGKNLDWLRPWPQNALLVVDRGSSTLIETPTYHVFRHLSMFVDPGATRVGISSNDGLAFQNPDGSLVAVLHNPGGSATQTTLGIGGTTVQFEVPAEGWATVHWQP